MKTSDLTGNVLDYWAGKAYGKTNLCLKNGKLQDISPSSILNPSKWHPSINWVQGGPIIDRERISLHGYSDSYEASSRLIPVKAAHMAPCYRMKGATALQAAMRCFVASVYGEEVDEEVVR